MLLGAVLLVTRPSDHLLANGPDNVSLGPIAGHTLSPGHAQRPNAGTSQFPLSGEEQWLARLTVDGGNVWNYNEIAPFVVDGEWWRIGIDVTRAIRVNLDLTVTLPIQWRTGGRTDGAIKGFHKLAQMDNRTRDRVPDDQVLVDITNNDGKRFLLKGGSWGPADIPVAITHLITPGGTACPAVSARLGATLPTGDRTQLEGIGEPVYFADALASKRLGASRHFAFFGLGCSYSRQDEWAGIPIHKYEISGMAGWEFRCNERLSLLAQYTVLSPVAKDYYEFSRTVNEVSVGFKRRIRNSGFAEAAITQNLFTFDNSTDFGVHVGAGRSF